MDDNNLNTIPSWQISILLAEDDPLQMLVTREMLRKEGYQIIEAVDGKQAFDLFMEKRPDLVLMDAKMPTEDGFSACERLSNFIAQEQLSIPIIIVTALEDGDAANRAFRAGADEFVTKPVNWEVLKRRISRLLERSVAYDRIYGLMQSAPLPMMMFGNAPEYPIRLINKQFTTLLGFDEQQLQQLDDFWKNLFPEEKYRDYLRQDWLHAVSEAISKHSSQSRPFLVSVINQTGKRLHLECYTNLHLDGGMMIFNDLTEQMEHERKLRNSEQFKDLLLESSGEGIYGIDLEGRCIFCNNSAVEMLGYLSSSEIIDQSMHQLTHHHYADGTPYPASECKVFRVIEDGLPIRVDNELFFRKDGSSFAVEYHAFPILRDNKIIGVVNNFSNISDRKARESQLKKLSAAVEFSPATIVITDTEGVLEYVNPAFTKTSGYSLQESIGKHIRFIKSGKTPKSIYTEIWKMISEGGTWEGELQNRRKDGTLYWERTTITAIKNSEGMIINYLGVKRDISEEKELRDQIWWQANHDSLTKLANRKYFHELLNNAMKRTRRSERSGAVLYLDIDRFKPVNDTLGHHIGDILLEKIAERLISRVRETDHIARIGGDEFAIIMEGFENLESDTQTVSESIVEAISSPFHIEGHQINIGISVGISYFSDQDQDGDTILKQADRAMYKAKSFGGQTTVVADETLGADEA